MGLTRQWKNGPGGLRVRLSTQDGHVDVWQVWSDAVLTVEVDAWRQMLAEIRAGWYDRPCTHPDCRKAA